MVLASLSVSWQWSRVTVQSVVRSPTPSALLGPWARAQPCPRTVPGGTVLQHLLWPHARHCLSCCPGPGCPARASSSNPQVQLTLGTGSLQVLPALQVMPVARCAALGPITLPGAYLLAGGSTRGPAEPAVPPAPMHLGSGAVAQA